MKHPYGRYKQAQNLNHRTNNSCRYFPRCLYTFHTANRRVCVQLLLMNLLKQIMRSECSFRRCASSSVAVAMVAMHIYRTSLSARHGTLLQELRFSAAGCAHGTTHFSLPEGFPSRKAPPRRNCFSGKKGTKPELVAGCHRRSLALPRLLQ